MAKKSSLRKTYVDCCDRQDYLKLYVMLEGAADEFLSIEDIHFVLDLAASDDNTEAIMAMFDGATKGGDIAKRKLHEAKSQTTNGILPGLKCKQTASIKLLLDGVGREDERYSTERGSMLHYACYEDNPDLVEYLIANDFPLYKENSEGETPLDMVCTLGNEWEKIGILLLEANADPNHINSNGGCSLNYAVSSVNEDMVRELIRYGAKVGLSGTSMPVLMSAVFTGNCEITKCLWEDSTFNPNSEDFSLALSSAIEDGCLSIVELLLEKGATLSDVDGFRLSIEYNQFHTLKALVNRGVKIRVNDLCLVFDSIVENDASNILSFILNSVPGLRPSDQNFYLEEIIKNVAIRCSEVFMKYLSETPNCNTSEILLTTYVELSASYAYEGNLLEYAGIRSEDLFLVLVKYINIEEIDTTPRIYHLLLENKHYAGLKELLDRSVTQHGNKIELKLKFLDSVYYEDKHPDENVYPSDGKYPKYAPSFLHKLNNCPSPSIKFHPLINAGIAMKISVYRWWYVLTFLLYCIFLCALFYALFSASYLCDEMLFNYAGSSGGSRVLCEVVVLIYSVIFSMDEFMEFSVNFIRFFYLEYSTMNLFMAFCNYNRHFLRHIPFLLKRYFDVSNIIDNLGLIFLLFLIIFRLLENPYQWTFASFTIIFFSLRLFKYTRIIPSLGAYVRSIFQIFAHDIAQFSVIIIIIMLAYFGGIHLAARQTFISPNSASSLLYSGQNCSNQSNTGLFWFDQMLYDLRRPLLSGIIFLLDEGPGNEEVTGLLNSGFLFTLLYISFAFTIIVVMSNVLIAQLSQTYSRITKDHELPFRLELVVSVEYESNLAFLFGKSLRNFTSIPTLVSFDQLEWKKLKEDSPQDENFLKIEESYHVLTHDLKESTNTFEIRMEDVKEDIDTVKQSVSHIGLKLHQDMRKYIGAVKQDTATIEKRMDRLEEMMTQVLDLLTQSTTTHT